MPPLTHPPNDALLAAPLGLSVLLYAAWLFLLNLGLGTLMLVPVIVVCVAAFLFHVVLEDSCESPAAYVGSLSKLAASASPQLASYLFVCVVMLAYIVIKRLDKDSTADRRKGGLCEASMEMSIRVGVTCVVISGVFPDAANSCAIDPGQACETARLSSAIHVGGVAFGGLLSIYGACALTLRTLIVAHGVAHDSHSMKAAAQGEGAPSRLWKRWTLRFRISAVLVALSALMSFYFAVCFESISNADEAASIHICTLYSSERACLGLDLPAGWRNATAWPCAWNETTPLGRMPCVDPSCKENGQLFNYQARIVYEYHALLCWINTLVGALLMDRRMFLVRQSRRGHEHGDEPAQPVLTCSNLSALRTALWTSMGKVGTALARTARRWGLIRSTARLLIRSPRRDSSCGVAIGAQAGRYGIDGAQSPL